MKSGDKPEEAAPLFQDVESLYPIFHLSSIAHRVVNPARSRLSPRRGSGIHDARMLPSATGAVFSRAPLTGHGQHRRLLFRGYAFLICSKSPERRLSKKGIPLCFTGSSRETFLPLKNRWMA